MISAIGWVALFASLDVSLSAPQTAMVLGTLAGAEAFGRLLVAGFERGGQDWTNALERILIRWTCVCVGFLLLLQFGLLPFFYTEPFAGVAVLGLSLGVAMLRLSAVVRMACFGKRSWVIHARLPIVAGVIVMADEVATLTPETLLSLMLLIFAIMVLGHFWDVRRALQDADGARVRSGKILLQAAPLLLKNADIFLLFGLFTPGVAFGYICARGLAVSVSLALDHLQEKAAAGLDGTEANGFVAAAARINLACMLVGGGAALGVLSITTFIAAHLDVVGVDFERTVLWLILGNAAPVIFGATGLLLGAAFMRRDATVLTLAGCVAFGVAASVQHITTPAQLAQLFASVQLGVAGLGAVLLVWRTGIWPGITAILFRQIKLF